MPNFSLNVEDTIVAIGSSHSPANRGVVRLSGPKCLEIAHRLGVQSQPKSAHRLEIQLDLGEPLGVVPAAALIWPNHRSYTGQPSVEFHAVGCLPILQSIVERLIEAGARAARPGEFTLRAFLAGRMDLTQAEAVLGVIEAEDRGSLDHALRQLAGNLSQPLENVRGELLDLLADVEAGLDFVDEEIQFITDTDLIVRLRSIAASIKNARDQFSSRRQDRSDTVVALRGLPNAGKSRLLNRLVGRDAAIVADVAGTTRDVVMVNVTWDEHSIRFLDTAGIEETEDQSLLGKISTRAQEQARRASGDADIRVWCVDQSDADAMTVQASMQAIAKERRRGVDDVWVATKCDRANSPVPDGWIPTSSTSGQGIDVLRRRLIDLIESQSQSDSNSVIGTAARCTGSLLAAEDALRSAIGYVEGDDGHEYVSAELRIAADAVGEVTGVVYTDDVLDRVFSRFCIGK
ncbi:MAG: tRNA modification GTPase [Planctomycetota bacterium]